MTTNAAADVLEYRNFLANVAHRFRQTARQELDSQDTFALIIDAGLSRTLQLHAAVALVLEHRYPVAAMIVARSAFELSVQYLWASREKDGWKRLQARWQDENQKFLDVAQKNPDFSALAARIRQGMPTIHDHPDTKQPPDMRTMLNQIEKRDRDAGLPVDAGWGEFLYLFLYKHTSGAVHTDARSLVSSETDDLSTNATGSICCSAYYLSRAICYSYGWNVDEVTAPLMLSLNRD